MTFLSGTFTNGEMFDSSHNRDTPYEFRLGRREVIRCWDEGIAQLSKGQRAQLTCPPEYAYGANGYTDVYP